MAVLSATAGTPFQHDGSVVGYAIGDVTWLNTAKALTADDDPATCEIDASKTWVLCVPFSANVPGFITGLRASIRLRLGVGVEGAADRFQGFGGGVSDAGMASLGSFNLSIDAAIGDPGFQSYSYGNSSNLWNISAATLKSRLAAGTLSYCQQYEAMGGLEQVHIDNVTLEVYYELDAGSLLNRERARSRPARRRA